MSVVSELKSRIAAGELASDQSQLDAAKQLDELLLLLSSRSIEFRNFRLRPTFMKGLYLWGGVGRGKSMLMDWFFDMAVVREKKRVHFHSFMLLVHSRINHWRKFGKGDPIKPVAEEIARESKLLCFDEFHVTDITDAMILSRLFEVLWRKDIVVVATSNRAPEELYKNGLNRSLFLPFIPMMHAHLKIYEFGGDTDHRLRQLQAAPVYYSPLGSKSEAAIDEAWQRLTGAARGHETILRIQGRNLVISQTAAGTARTTFNYLCARALGAADYLKLSHAFQTLILENVPKLGAHNRNEAKRFVTLIDTLYETKTKLIISAEVEPHDLYNKGDGAFEFERTSSRLMEMRSAEYLSKRRVLTEGQG